jgi:predicted nucleic acid-binding protein
VILVETGPIVAAASNRDENHATCLAALSDLREPALITPLVVMEVCYFLSTRATAVAEAAFLRSIAVGSFDLVTLTRDDLDFHQFPGGGVDQEPGYRLPLRAIECDRQRWMRVCGIE